jgi:8-oxo-dGTP diphosphatase
MRCGSNWSRCSGKPRRSTDGLTMSAVIEVAAGILTRNDRVLACRRRFEGSHAGKWEFPGGKRQPGESLTACLRRELREELGIDAVVGPELWRTRHFYRPHSPVDVFFFQVTSYTDTVCNRAFAEIRWVKRAELSRLDFLEADRPLVQRLQREPCCG